MVHSSWSSKFYSLVFYNITDFFSLKNGTKRMNKLLDSAKNVLTSTNLSVIIDDIMNVAKILTNPGKECT